MSSPQNPESSQPFNLLVRVRNQGWQASQPNSLFIFDDLDFNQVPDSSERLASLSLAWLAYGEVLTATIAMTLAEGNHRIGAHLGEDDKPYNNLKFFDLRVGQFLSDVIINEIMAAPDPSKNQTEWVEFYNRSQKNINLRSWQMGDSKLLTILTTDLFDLPASGFVILAEDKNKFQASYPAFSGIVIQPSSWPSLDNEGDEVFLKDSLGFLAEKVSYPHQSLKGISWERIDYNKIGSDSDNWWRSVDPSGATPGRRNSVQAGFSSSIEVQIKPNPFSPDDDGFDDQTEIDFKIPLGVDLTMKIFDRKGRLIRTLFENQAQVSGKVSWDGRKDDGDKVRTGIYILFVETKGEKREVRKETIAVVKGR